MIQDIAPAVFDRRYQTKAPQAESVVCAFRGWELLCRLESGQLVLPRFAELSLPPSALRHAFAIDGRDYYLLLTDAAPAEEKGFSYQPLNVFRKYPTRPESFAVATAWQLFSWYNTERFCSCCGGVMQPSETDERSLVCTNCGRTIYPQIAPVIVVGVCNGEKLLLTRYANRAYRDYALVAGFCEIGETLEDAVAREVREEVGLQVKNIRYFASQPWGLTSILMMGFFADVDGGLQPHPDGKELAEAVWMERKELLGMDDGISLTRALIQAFAEGKESVAVAG